MAKNKGKIEDTVKDIIDTGMDFRERLITANVATDNIIKPANFDGIFLTNATGGTTVAIVTAGTEFNHHLNREPQGRIVVDQSMAGSIWIHSKNKSTITMKSSADMQAKIIIF